jgi:hypothetical protein
MLTRIANFVLATVYRTLGPYAMGFLVGLVSVRRAGDHVQGPNVLALIHPIFAKDQVEMARYGRVNWFTVSLSRLSRFQKSFLPPDTRRQRFYYATLEDPRYRAAWQEAEAFGRGILQSQRLRGGVSAVLTAHVDYWQAEGIRLACRESGIPFLILCHENYLIRKTYDLRRKEFESIKFKFGGSAIAVFSEKMRTFFTEAEVCAPEQLIVTGPPRFDGWRSLSIKPQKLIVLLSYLAPLKYYGAEEFFEAVNVVRDMVRRNPDWKLVIKCKAVADERVILSQIQPEDRVVISHELPIAELLAGASIVVGSNSLSLLEALISSAKLIMPVNPTTMDEADTLMLDISDPTVRECITIVNTMSDLESEIQTAMQLSEPAPVDYDKRFSLLQRFLFVTRDEPASERVLGLIEKHIASSKAEVVKLGASVVEARRS